MWVRAAVGSVIVAHSSVLAVFPQMSEFFVARAVLNVTATLGRPWMPVRAVTKSCGGVFPILGW